MTSLCGCQGVSDEGEVGITGDCRSAIPEGDATTNSSSGDNGAGRDF